MTKKEKEWIDLVGKEEWFSIDSLSRRFLLRTSGILDFDIKLPCETDNCSLDVRFCDKICKKDYICNLGTKS